MSARSSTQSVLLNLCSQQLLHRDLYFNHKKQGSRRVTYKTWTEYSCSGTRLRVSRFGRVLTLQPWPGRASVPKRSTDSRLPKCCVCCNQSADGNGLVCSEQSAHTTHPSNLHQMMHRPKALEAKQYRAFKGTNSNRSDGANPKKRIRYEHEGSSFTKWSQGCCMYSLGCS